MLIGDPPVKVGESKSVSLSPTCAEKMVVAGAVLVLLPMGLCWRLEGERE